MPASRMTQVCTELRDWYCKMFEWEEVQGEIRITGCSHSPDILNVPEEIAGLPVAQIGDYAFRGMETLGEVNLPASLRFLGDHVFFNCIHLKKLSVYDTLCHVGDGAFKNCDQLSEIAWYVRRNRASALRLLISDVMGDVRADIFYETAQARLMFPAFYFDYIENYPARIFEEVIYGSGQAYRQCFRGGDIDYEAYDRLFERSTREDEMKTVLEHAVGRLSCPWKLTKERRAVYQTWLSSHGAELIRKCMDAETPEDLERMLSLDFYDEKQTQEMISLALQRKNVEFVNLLMAYQGRRFAGRTEGRRKRYVL